MVDLKWRVHCCNLCFYYAMWSSLCLEQKLRINFKLGHVSPPIAGECMSWNLWEANGKDMTENGTFLMNAWTYEVSLCVYWLTAIICRLALVNSKILFSWEFCCKVHIEKFVSIDFKRKSQLNIELPCVLKLLFLNRSSYCASWVLKYLELKSCGTI